MNGAVIMKKLKMYFPILPLLEKESVDTFYDKLYLVAVWIMCLFGMCISSFSYFILKMKSKMRLSSRREATSVFTKNKNFNDSLVSIIIAGWFDL